MKHIKSIIFAAVCLAGWIPEAFGGSKPEYEASRIPRNSAPPPSPVAGAILTCAGNNIFGKLMGGNQYCGRDITVGGYSSGGEDSLDSNTALLMALAGQGFGYGGGFGPYPFPPYLGGGGYGFPGAYPQIYGAGYPH